MIIVQNCALAANNLFLKLSYSTITQEHASRKRTENGCLDSRSGKHYPAFRDNNYQQRRK